MSVDVSKAEDTVQLLLLRMYGLSEREVALLQRLFPNKNLRYDPLSSWWPFLKNTWVETCRATQLRQRVDAVVTRNVNLNIVAELVYRTGIRHVAFFDEEEGLVALELTTSL